MVEWIVIEQVGNRLAQNTKPINGLVGMTFDMPTGSTNWGVYRNGDLIISGRAVHREGAMLEAEKHLKR